MRDNRDAGDGSLAPGPAALVRLSAALGTGSQERRDAALGRAADAVDRGLLRAGQVEEALLQAYLFLGFPAVLAAMAAWRRRVGRAPARERDPLAEPEGPEGWAERGREVCRRVYGSAYGKLRRRVAGLHPAMDRWMVTEGYGKVLGRPGLDLPQRELCTAALLATSGWGPQLHSHLRGALNVGVPPEEVEAALALALEEVEDGAAAEDARAVWRRVREDGSRPPGGDSDDTGRS